MNNISRITCELVLMHRTNDIKAENNVGLYVRPIKDDTLNISSQKCGLAGIKEKFVKLYNTRSIVFCDGGFVLQNTCMYDVEEGLKLVTPTKAIIREVEIWPKKIVVLLTTMLLLQLG